MTNIEKNNKTETEKLYVEFGKVYVWEGQELRGVNLAPLEDMTCKQLMRVDEIFERSGAVSGVREMNVKYCLLAAAEVTGLPLEFFEQLSARDGAKVKTRVSAYFFDLV